LYTDWEMGHAPRKKVPLKNPPLTAAELKIAETNRAAAREKRIERREQHKDELQRKMNEFGRSLQGALLPAQDNAAAYGKSAPNFGGADIGPGR
jgi:hypothetical protein